MAACNEVRKPEKVYRILEFYSGIGGMHYAAKACGFETNVVAAFEINTTANTVYRHNFPDTSLCQRNIEGITANDIDKLSGDIFLMSPPCQPFTRVGLKGASNDPRTKSFLHILDMLSKLSKPPDYILMENVKGFEISDTREHFVNTLKEARYTYQEFLVSPNQFGIPNSRLRYYMLAKRKPHQFHFITKDEVLNHIPPLMDELQGAGHSTSCFKCNSTNDAKLYNHYEDKEHSQHCANIYIESKNQSCCVQEDLENKNLSTFSASSLQKPDLLELNKCKIESTNNIRNSSIFPKQKSILEFLESKQNEKYLSQFLLPEKVLSRFALVLDIVTPSSTHSCCFTKAYGHYAEGTGSVLKTTDIDDSDIFNEYRALGPDASDSQRAAVLSDLRLRYFTPREVANIMRFPNTFDFPQGISLKQQYRLLGNSLNVHVVTELLKCLLHG